MPRITVQINVPDGDWCGECDYLKIAYDWTEICPFFGDKEKRKKHPDCLLACRDAETNNQKGE